MNHDIPDYATYAHLQLAAETLAQAFMDEGWAVVDRISTTTTGFSGSLFRHGTSGEWVLSLSSNGFAVTGATRDHPTVHTLEFRERGWAFGQIADMEAWFQGLETRGHLPPNAAYSVTGFGLGGHLVRAFKLLRGRDGSVPRILRTYTFNGVGMDNLIHGDLKPVISAFQHARTHGSEALFTLPLTRSIYGELRQLVNGEARSQEVAVVCASLLRLLDDAQARPVQDPSLVIELGLLVDALESVQSALAVVGERRASLRTGDAERLATLQARPEATRLDYQLAAQTAAGSAHAFALSERAVPASDTDHAYSFSEQWYEDRCSPLQGQTTRKNNNARPCHPEMLSHALDDDGIFPTEEGAFAASGVDDSVSGFS